jgi:hypothetical protein
MGRSVELTLDTSVLWDQFCLIEVCLIWGGRSITLSQVVIEHVSATVGFAQYRHILEAVQDLLPPDLRITLLADRGFEHGELIRWLGSSGWSWAIRGKIDLQVTLPSGGTQSAAELLPHSDQAYLFSNVKILGDITCHLATANLSTAQETWIVLSDRPPSLQTFALYGKRFGGIEPHFKDYKSAAFNVLDSHLRDPQPLTCLFMLMDCASLIAIVLGMMLESLGRRAQIDWHYERGLSFLQLGLRELQRLVYQREPLPALTPLPKKSPPTDYASVRKREQMECRIEFSCITAFK